MVINMRVSNYFLFTLKKVTKEAKLISHKFMLKAGIIRRSNLGLYNWLPTGVRVLNKLNSIIREEMNSIGAVEILMPFVQSVNLWKKSGRFQEYGSELVSFFDRSLNRFILSPTNEESVTQFVSNEFRSYKSFPLIFYQINTKFRDELRPNSGVIRSKEFVMKDAYSFHVNRCSLIETYNMFYRLYEKIFKRIGLKYQVIQADSGSIGGNISHEFKVLYDLCKYNSLFFNEKKQNFKMKTLKNNFILNNKINKHIKNGIEVGHIFQVGKKYSTSIGSFFYDKNGNKKELSMGCYGIGVTRSIAAVIEQNHDKNGIIWPQSIAPFQVALIPINMSNDFLIRKVSEEIYLILKKNKIDVLFYDLNESFGIMYANIELIGIPHILIVGKNYFKNGMIEYKNRRKNNIEFFKLFDLINFINKKLF